MNNIMNFITGGGLEANSTMLFGAIFFTFMFMFFFVLGVSDIVQRRNDIRRRASFDPGLDYTSMTANDTLESSERSLRFQSFVQNTALLAKIERGQRSTQEKETEKTKLERELVSAGFFGSNSTLWFQGIRFTLLVGVPLIMHIAISLSETAFPQSTHMAILAAAGGVAFLLPGRYLVQRQKAMRQQCRDGFPDFMDLLVVCSEAGLSPRAAIDKISREISHSYPYLGANLYLMSLELRAGSSLVDAIDGLARRTQIEEVINLGSLLQQTEQLGTSLTDTLRIYSDEMRDKRLSRAEEKAHALPVKLTLPLGLFIFPVMLVVIALPIIVRIQNSFF